jgi:hypothetical protein
MQPHIRYWKEVRRLIVSCFFLLCSGILTGCISNYRIDNSRALYKTTEASFNSFWFLIPKTDDSHLKILRSIDSGLERNLQAMGIKKDSLRPDLLFMLQWETHLIGRHSPSTNEVMQAHSITSPLYPSDQLESNSFRGKGFYYDEESFYRVLAIDAINKELVWSAKIYPHKTSGLKIRSMPQVIQDLTWSFAQVRFNNSKIRIKK